MKYFNNKPIRLIECFAGIGSQAKALKNIGVDFEHWRVCEFDKHAINSYNAVHSTNFVTSDITKLTASDLNITDTEHFTYLLTYSFPCQDLSNAGLGRGMEKGSGTRSGLLWEVERLLNECDELPQVLLMENVPQVHGKKNIEHFEKWIAFLESKGYSNFWQDLNAKDYGIPQNRNRCYMVSILGEHSYKFPTPISLTLKLSDMLESNVDEKYYLSDKKLNTIHKWKSLERPLEKVYGKNSIARTLTTRSGAECGSLATYSEQFEETTSIVPLLDAPTSDLKRTLCNELLDRQLVTEGDVIRHSYTRNRLENGIENMSRIESKEKISPTLDTRCDCLGVVVKQGEINVVGNYSPSNHDASRIVHPDGIAPTVKENHGTVTATIQKIDIPQTVRVRKYPVDTDKLRECLRTHKELSNCSNNVIARLLNVPLTKVEHWFRQDECFAIPDADIWFALKQILGITTGEFDKAIMTFEERIGVYEKSERHYFTDGISPTLTSASSGSEKFIHDLRIRKLTPKECWRLMGFDDEDFERAEKVCSNSQLYKQAGNSIVVNVLMAIFKELFEPKKTRSEWLDELLN